VIDAALQDFGLAPAFLMGLDLHALCADDDAQIVYTFLDAMNEVNPAWMALVRARGGGDNIEEDARAQIDTFRHGFDRNVCKAAKQCSGIDVKRGLMKDRGLVGD
jgi:hypothetical protein